MIEHASEIVGIGSVVQQTTKLRFGKAVRFGMPPYMKYYTRPRMNASIKA